MRITRLRLTDFKRHDQLEIEPAAGLTIVRGPNEAGKSTIQDALELGLFRKADSMARDVGALQRWGTTEAPIVEIEFEADGKTGRLRKRFAGQKAEAELTHGEESTRDNSLIGERIGRLTGIPTEAFFRATASVGHAELSEVGGDEPIIQDRLQKAISGADRGTAAAKKKLADAIHRYKTEGHKNPGLIKVNRAEIEQLEVDLAAGEQALAQLEVDRAQWVEAHERRERLDAELARHETDLAEARRAEQLSDQRATTQERYERLKRAAELVTQENELRRGTPTEIPITTLRTGVARAGSLELDISELDAELSVDVEAAAAEEAATRAPRPWRWVALAVGLAIAGFAAWAVIGDVVGVAAWLVLMVLTVAASVQSIRMALRARQHALAHELSQSAVAARQQADHDRQETFRHKSREFEELLASLGVADVEEGQRLLARAEEHSSQLAEIEGELRGLGVEERSVRRLEADRDQAANEAEQASHALAGMGALADDPASARASLQKLVEKTKPERDAARSQEDQALGRVDSNSVDAEAVAALAERRIGATARQTQLETRLAIYVATLAAIEDAEKATLKTAARYLEERMGPAIKRVTAGRYDEIEVDEQNLAFRVRVPETGELEDVTQLSQGTSDQLYLAARLGLVRLVTMDRRPPLILDDPFVTFDGARGERALRLVKEVATEQGFQVIYLTTSDRFDALADELVVLEGPEPLAVTSTAAAVPGAVAATPVAEPEAPAAEPVAPVAEPVAPVAEPVAPAAVPAPEPATPTGEPAAEPTGPWAQVAPPAVEPAAEPTRSTDAGHDPDTGVIDPFGLHTDAGSGAQD